METNATPVTTTSVALHYGLLLAASGILVDFLVRIANFSFLTYGIVAGLTALIVTIVWIVLAHSAFKKANNGLMTFKQGLIIAMIMVLLSAIIASLFNFLYLNYIDEDFVERMKAGMTEFMEKNNVPEDQIAKSTAKFDEMNVGIVQSLLNGLKNGVIGGLVLGALITAFTKRSHPEFE
ncbi:DUF4199 domain-containing protein [Hymenobacter sp. 5317J-9]|uniref:DUF4199 domain-containing protein n=1 Tax=Hymenobacter sp. 5317J-9 TaxID=2932250 RepID=UPI001FD6F3C1|nr:DUF4199 domain-containing protein [Hymenobacter sp. 5317J-9]UOQ99439.1 DUF4199 domain-containing protein [Hymenobacter sp. 5317J-9]